MKELVEALADLGGLRDREAQDFAVASLVRSLCKDNFIGLKLVHLLGESENLRCILRTKIDAQHPVPEREKGWFDFSALPLLSSHPLRQNVFVQGKPEAFLDENHCTVFPVGKSGHVNGFVEVDSQHPLDPEIIGVIEGVIRAYQNAQALLDYGERDTLTELFNRKSFDNAFFRSAVAQSEMKLLPEHERRNALDQSSFWLAVADIDHFKRVNDNFGHLIGDEVLLLLAGIMRNNFRLDDQLYRFGGEEFVVLMRCLSHDDALHVLERFRLAVEAHPFPQVGRITVSVGFSALKNGDTPADVFGRADKAVYFVKDHGRNQVRSYSNLIESGELVEEVASSGDFDLF